MNILFVHEVDWLKKVVFEIHNLAELLSLRGHQVYAIDYPDTWTRDNILDLGSLRTQETSGVSRALQGASVYLRRPGYLKLPVLSRLSAGFTHYREIERTIKEKKIDVIILYSVPTNGLQTIRLAGKFNIPVIFRSIDILHKLVHYPALRQATKIIEKMTYSRVDAILAITPHHAQYVINMGASESRVDLLLLPIDRDIFHPSTDCSAIQQKWGLNKEVPVIVFVGTLFEFSGLDGFIQEFPGILQQIPNARLLIVGDGPQRSTLEKIIAELGLQKYVTITGFQPYQTMPQYMNLATICINPFVVTERTEDVFPGKIIQYIACGKVTIATPSLGITTLIPDKTNGIIYASDARTMAQEAISLLKSPEYRQQLEHAGLDYIKQNHDQISIGHKLETYLEKFVKEKHNEVISTRMGRG